jgi:hypothetical protein
MVTFWELSASIGFVPAPSKAFVISFILYERAIKEPSGMVKLLSFETQSFPRDKNDWSDCRPSVGNPASNVRGCVGNLTFIAICPQLPRVGFEGVDLVPHPLDRTLDKSL